MTSPSTSSSSPQRRKQSRMARQTYPCECLRCGNKWEARTEAPYQCPECKSFIWDVPPDFRPLSQKRLGARKDLRGNGGAR